MKLLKKGKGQALVEFALVMPILMIILGMIVSGAQILYSQLSLNMAAYEAARQGIVQPNIGAANQVAKQIASDQIKNSPLMSADKLTVKGSAGSWVRSNSYKVRLEYPVRILIPIPGLTGFSFGDVHIISAEASLAIEYRP